MLSEYFGTMFEILLTGVLYLVGFAVLVCLLPVVAVIGLIDSIREAVDEKR